MILNMSLWIVLTWTDLTRLTRYGSRFPGQGLWARKFSAPYASSFWVLGNQPMTYKRPATSIACPAALCSLWGRLSTDSIRDTGIYNALHSSLSVLEPNHWVYFISPTPDCLSIAQRFRVDLFLAPTNRCLLPTGIKSCMQTRAKFRSAGNCQDSAANHF